MKKYKSFFVKIFSIQLVALFLIILLSVLLSLSAISEIIYDKTEKELEDLELVSPRAGEIEKLFVQYGRSEEDADYWMEEVIEEIDNPENLLGFEETVKEFVEDHYQTLG